MPFSEANTFNRLCGFNKGFISSGHKSFTPSRPRRKHTRSCLSGSSASRTTRTRASEATTSATSLRAHPRHIIEHPGAKSGAGNTKSPGHRRRGWHRSTAETRCASVGVDCAGGANAARKLNRCCPSPRLVGPMIRGLLQSATCENSCTPNVNSFKVGTLERHAEARVRR